MAHARPKMPAQQQKLRPSHPSPIRHCDVTGAVHSGVARGVTSRRRRLIDANTVRVPADGDWILGARPAPRRLRGLHGAQPRHERVGRWLGARSAREQSRRQGEERHSTSLSSASAQLVDIPISDIMSSKVRRIALSANSFRSLIDRGPREGPHQPAAFRRSSGTLRSYPADPGRLLRPARQALGCSLHRSPLRAGSWRHEPTWTSAQPARSTAATDPTGRRRHIGIRTVRGHDSPAAHSA